MRRADFAQIICAHDVQLTVVLPVILKRILLDDRERVVVRGQLHALPCKPSVADILAEYSEVRQNRPGTENALAPEVEVRGVHAGCLSRPVGPSCRKLLGPSPTPVKLSGVSLSDHISDDATCPCR